MITQVPQMGCHLILDFHGTSVNMNNYEELNKNFTRIILGSGATIENQMYKQFEPQGLSMLYLLSESHFSIHTWPEHGACAIDFYHCGETARERMIKAEELLCEYLGWENCTGSMIIDRGTYHYALIKQDEHSSILYKKHKLVERQKSELFEQRIYENESVGKLLAVDGLIQMGFHNIQNLGDLFEGESEFPQVIQGSSNSCSTLSLDKLDYFNDKTDSDESPMNENSSDKKITFTTKLKEEKNILIIGAGDLSLPNQILNNFYSDNVTVLDGDINPKERLKVILSNNKELGLMFDNYKVKFVSDLKDVFTKFDGVIVVNKRHKPHDLKGIMKNGAFYSEIIMNKREFDEICKFEELRNVSFHEVSNTITRFLIGKGRYS